MRWLAMVCAMWASGVCALEKPCPFDWETLSFDGAAVDQAKCLLRPVKPLAILGRPRNLLPQALESRIGQIHKIDSAALSTYLRTRGISEASVGGKLDAPLSHIRGPGNEDLQARYFVIHDTSSPNLRLKPFPDDINEASWEHNGLAQHDKGDASKAHAFINRLGESIVPISFGHRSLSTKFEKEGREEGPYRLRGLFIHVELIQPRRSRKPSGKDDAIAPDPGFTPAQYERLALMYVVASHRASRWMIPAYHAAVDAGLSDGHDDPQKFDLDQWASAVDAIATAVESTGD